MQKYTRPIAMQRDLVAAIPSDFTVSPVDRAAVPTASALDAKCFVPHGSCEQFSEPEDNARLIHADAAVVMSGLIPQDIDPTIATRFVVISDAQRWY